MHTGGGTIPVGPRVTGRAARLAAGLLACLVITSCQRGVTVYPVRGQVLVAGKPAVGATVVFHPVDAAGPRPLRPAGVVQEDGSFTLRTYDPQTCPTPQDGAPAGEYLVTVNWLPPDYAEYRNVLPDKLHGRYVDPKTSGLRATVQPGPNELPPFRLDATPKPDGGRR